jgi:hypothetical protein
MSKLSAASSTIVFFSLYQIQLGMSKSDQGFPPKLPRSRNIRTTRWGGLPSFHVHNKVFPEEIAAQDQWVFDHGAVGEVHLGADSLGTETDL